MPINAVWIPHTQVGFVNIVGWISVGHIVYVAREWFGMVLDQAEISVETNHRNRMRIIFN